MTAEQRGRLKEIVGAALARVEPRSMIEETVSIVGSTLQIETETTHEEINLELFDRIIVLGAGKASIAPMITIPTVACPLVCDC